MGLTAHYSDRHPLPTVHTERELFMINEDGFRSLGSATISRRRLLGGLAGSAVVLGGGSLLSGCTGTSAPAAGSSASASKTASFGSSAVR